MRELGNFHEIFKLVYLKETVGYGSYMPLPLGFLKFENNTFFIACPCSNQDPVNVFVYKFCFEIMTFS